MSGRPASGSSTTHHAQPPGTKTERRRSMERVWYSGLCTCRLVLLVACFVTFDNSGGSRCGLRPAGGKARNKGAKGGGHTPAAAAGQHITHNAREPIPRGGRRRGCKPASIGVRAATQQGRQTLCRGATCRYRAACTARCSGREGRRRGPRCCALSLRAATSAAQTAWGPRTCRCSASNLQRRAEGEQQQGRRWDSPPGDEQAGSLLAGNPVRSA